MLNKLATSLFRVRYRVGRKLAMRRMARTPKPILVYTIGKTGSTSIVRTLGPVAGRPVWQMHRLQADAIDERERELEMHRPRWASHHLWVSQHFRHRLPTPERPWDVITLTRDPLAQSVASFFQATLGGRNYIDDDANVMLQTYLAKHDVYRVLDWFDNELCRHLGIDIFDYPLTRGEPLFIQTPAVRLLLLRLEDLDRVGPATLLSEFAGVKVERINRSNLGDNKVYSDAYQRFKAKAVLPKELVERHYESRYARHFYSADEIARFRAAWRTTD